jgi:hypothetical protein
MRQTIQLLQLLILVFAGYGYYTFSPDFRLYFILGCLVVAYILEKIDVLILDRQKLQALIDERNLEAGVRKKSNTPLGILMQPATSQETVGAITRLFKKLRFTVTTPAPEQGVDLEFWAAGSSMIFGLKVFDSVDDIGAETPGMEQLEAYATPSGSQRLIIICNNIRESKTAKQQFQLQEFSPQSEAFFCRHQLLALTTTTLRTIFLLCRKKGIDPRLFLKLFREHRGGVFRLEDYAKK